MSNPRDEIDQSRYRAMVDEIASMAWETRHDTGRHAFSQPVLDAMRQIPRHCFVPDELCYAAYLNRPLSIGHGQTISQPYIVTLITELLRLDKPGAGHDDFRFRVVAINDVEVMKVAAGGAQDEDSWFLHWSILRWQSGFRLDCPIVGKDWAGSLQFIKSIYGAQRWSLPLRK